MNTIENKDLHILVRKGQISYVNTMFVERLSHRSGLASSTYYIF